MKTPQAQTKGQAPAGNGGQRGRRPGSRPFRVGRPLDEWPGLRATEGRCAAGGCRAPAVVYLGDLVFCRAHWPAARAWWLGESVGEALDLHQLYGRREALAYFNEQMAERGHEPISEATFLKMQFEALYPDTFRLEPLALGERSGVLSDGRYATVTAFTRRMLDEAASRRPGRIPEVTRPTEAERAAFLTASEAVAWLGDWWATRGIQPTFTITPRHLLYFQATGRVPALRVGRVNVFLKRDLERLAHAAAESTTRRNPWEPDSLTRSASAADEALSGPT